MELADLSDAAWFTIVLTFAHGLAFWVPNVFLLVARHKNWFPQYRLTNKPFSTSSPSSVPPKHEEPPAELVREAVLECAINHWAVFPVLAYLAFGLLRATGVRMDGPLPSIPSMVFELVFYLFCNETMSYWVHRALHHRWFYKSIHKKHHTFARSVGVAAEYSHPVESALNGVIPLFIGPILFSLCGNHLAKAAPAIFAVSGGHGHGTHYGFLATWVAARTLDTVNAHSGYQFPAFIAPFNNLLGCGGAEFHDFHHSHNIGNYGAVTYLWDYVCGTDKAYRRWLTAEKKR